MKISTLLFFSFLVFTSKAQNTFQKVYGGPGNDLGHSIFQTSDNGFIISGQSGSNLLLNKIDSSGIVQWAETVDIVQPDFGNFHAYSVVKQLRDTGYIACGTSSSSSFIPGGFGFYLLRTNSSGTILWTKGYGGIYQYYLQTLETTFDSGFIVAGDAGDGSTQLRAFIAKTDSAGTVLWSKTFDDASLSGAQFKNVIQTPDSGFIAVGNTTDVNNYQRVLMVKLNKNGIVSWTKTFALETPPTDEIANKIVPTPDGNYMLCGTIYSFPNGYSYDCFLLKTDPSGNPLWCKSYFTNPYKEETASSLAIMPDSGIVVTGVDYRAYSDNPLEDLLLFKTDKSGNVLWSKNYGGNADDGATDMLETRDGKIIVAGYTRSFSAGMKDLYIIKTDNTVIDSCNQKDYPLNVSSFSPVVGTISNSFWAITVASGNPTASPITLDTNNACVCKPPVANFITIPNGTFPGFKDSSTWAATWFWNFGDGFNDTLENTQHDYSPSLSGFGADTFLVCLTVANACGSDSICDSIIILSTAVPEYSQSSRIIISPNPFSSEAALTISGIDDGIKNIEIKIVDARGKLVRSETADAKSEIIISRNNLSPGLYFIQLSDEKEFIGTVKTIIK